MESMTYSQGERAGLAICTAVLNGWAECPKSRREAVQLACDWYGIDWNEIPSTAWYQGLRSALAGQRLLRW